MWLPPSRRDSQWVKYFKLVILKTLNVRFGLAFLKPVTNSNRNEVIINIVFSLYYYYYSIYVYSESVVIVSALYCNFQSFFYIVKLFEDMRSRNDSIFQHIAIIFIIVILYIWKLFAIGFSTKVYWYKFMVIWCPVAFAWYLSGIIILCTRFSYVCVC